MKHFCFFLLLLADQPLTNAGTRFVVGGFKKDVGDFDRPILYVTTPESGSVSFSVSDGVTPLSSSVAPAQTTSIDLQKLSFESSNNGILISSDDGVSKLVVVAERTIFGGVSGDTFTLYPVQEYGSYTYFAMSIEAGTDNDEHKGFVHVVGTQNGTRVTITPTQDLNSLATDYGCSGTANVDCELTLNALQTLVLRSSYDLTGTKIVSNAPLSVFSGHECGYVPTDLTSLSCKTLTEQIPPVVTWGRSFLGGPLLRHQDGEWYKVMAAEEGTNVDLYCEDPDRENIYSMRFELATEGSFQYFTVGVSRRCSIIGDKPLLVTLFATNTQTQTGTVGAFMAVVPSITQYSSTVTLTLQPQADNNTVTITIPFSSCPNTQCFVEVDGHSTFNVATMSEEIRCSAESEEACGYVVTGTLPNGTYTLSLSGSDAGPLGVISYTHRAGSFGTGTVGGFSLNHIVGWYYTIIH